MAVRSPANRAPGPGWTRNPRRRRHAAEVRVIFDNTATRAAADNARSMIGKLAR
jgi:hypothetical protein